MNICLDARTVSPHFPGIGRYTFNLARALVPQLERDEQLLLLHDPSSPSPLDLRTLVSERARLVDTRISPFSIRQQWAIPRLLRETEVDLYHSPYYLMPYWTGVATVLTVHDLVPLRYPQYFRPPQRLLFSAAIRLALRAAGVVIVVSTATADDLRQLAGYPADRIRVISEAADPTFQPALREQVAALRARWRLPEHYVLSLGSNKPHKNLPRLVEAWARLQPTSLPLVIAGVWDPRYPQARQGAEALRLGEAVRFLGPVAEEDLPALYTGATLVVFPSEHEGFGLPVIEAMACGAPVACSNAPGVREVAGQATVLFDPLNVDDMAGAIGAVLGDARRCALMAERGRARAAQLSWQEAARSTLRAYRGVTTPD